MTKAPRPVIDAWMQDPTASFVGHEMFASLRRWMGEGNIPADIPVEMTRGAMEAAGVTRAMVSAWIWPPVSGSLSFGPSISALEAERLQVSREEWPGHDGVFRHLTLGDQPRRLLPMIAPADAPSS